MFQNQLCASLITSKDALLSLTLADVDCRRPLHWMMFSQVLIKQIANAVQDVGKAVLKKRVYQHNLTGLASADKSRQEGSL